MKNSIREKHSGFRAFDLTMHYELLCLLYKLYLMLISL